MKDGKLLPLMCSVLGADVWQKKLLGGRDGGYCHFSFCRAFCFLTFQKSVSETQGTMVNAVGDFKDTSNQEQLISQHYLVPTVSYLSTKQIVSLALGTLIGVSFIGT